MKSVIYAAMCMLVSGSINPFSGVGLIRLL